MREVLYNICKEQGLVNWAQEQTNNLAAELVARNPHVDPTIIGALAKSIVKETVKEMYQK